MASVTELEYDAVLGETDKAYHILFDEHDHVAKWIPKDHCELDVDAKTITVADWLVEKEGLEDYAA